MSHNSLLSESVEPLVYYDLSAIGVGRFRILGVGGGGARFRILGGRGQGLEYWGGAMGGQIPSRHMTSSRRRCDVILTSCAHKVFHKSVPNNYISHLKI